MPPIKTQWCNTIFRSLCSSGRENVTEKLNEGTGWYSWALHRRARRALERQLAYQRAKAQSAVGHEQEYITSMRARSMHVREVLEGARAVTEDARVLEVGSGAHGLIFYFGTTRCMGVDPLATYYARLFPEWQRRVQTLAAYGEQLPFADNSFDFVLCDNVVDHAEFPARIVSEMARVLIPGGLLYFTVNLSTPLPPVFTQPGTLQAFISRSGISRTTPSTSHLKAHADCLTAYRSAS
jgi:SAM-dependent methyltransferase